MSDCLCPKPGTSNSRVSPFCPLHGAPVKGPPHVASTTNRGSGRTSRMLQSLPVENTPTVVVHTQEMCDHVRNLARQLRPDLRHPIRVRIVRDVRDCDYLRGLQFVVDHAMLEQASEPVASLLRALGKRRDLTRWESNP